MVVVSKDLSFKYMLFKLRLILCLIDSTCFFLCPAVKEAAVQRRHNLFRDSIVLTNSDPNLHLLGETPPVDWASKFGEDEPDGELDGSMRGGSIGKRRRQVVSMIQMDGVPLAYESCLEVPGVDLIPEENTEGKTEDEDEENPELSKCPKSPDSVTEIRGLIYPMVEVEPETDEEENENNVSNRTEATKGLITMNDGLQEEVTHVTTIVEDPRKSPSVKMSPQVMLQHLMGSRKEAHKEKTEMEDDSEQVAEGSGTESDSELSSRSLPATESGSRNDSGFQSPTHEKLEEAHTHPITNGLNGEKKIIDPVEVEVILA